MSQPAAVFNMNNSTPTPESRRENMDDSPPLARKHTCRHIGHVICSPGSPPFIFCPSPTTPGNGWVTWFSQSLVLTPSSVCGATLIASARRGEASCPALLHYAAFRCVLLPQGSRFLCYQNDDACQKHQPRLHYKLCVCSCTHTSYFTFIDRMRKNEQEGQSRENYAFIYCHSSSPGMVNWGPVMERCPVHNNNNTYARI